VRGAICNKKNATFAHKKAMQKLITFLLFLPLLLPAQDLRLGKIDFPTSCQNKEAQELFIKGTLLLHSFEYEDAREFYQQAQELAPDFVMAYWGEAMTHNHPIWMRQYAEPARKALQKLGPNAKARLAKATDEKERAWLQAVEILFAEAGTKEARDYRYSDQLAAMHQQYPEDLEVASFYALSILGTSHKARDTRKYMQAASVVEQVYEKNPTHPGALHYLIHSYDDPVHAPLGLRAAHRYAKVAPAAAHALHMPSHIFVAIGDWEQVVASNEDSWKASLERQARKGLGLDSRGYHSFWWLAYGYLQQGNLERAEMLLDSMAHDASRSDERTIHYHLTMMRAAHLIDSEDWQHRAFAMQPRLELLTEKTQAVYHFSSAYAAWKRGEMGAVKKHHNALKTLIPTSPILDQTDDEGAKCCALPSGGLMSEQTLNVIQVMDEMLQAIALYAQGEKDDALIVLEAAAEREGSLSFMFGPPVIAKPSHELMGEWLLEMKIPKEAQAAFEAGLQRAPGRRLAVQGNIAAEKALGELGKSR
jgi:tetratricopeptide (TPR) repeat protein